MAVRNCRMIERETWITIYLPFFFLAVIGGSDAVTGEAIGAGNMATTGLSSAKKRALSVE